MNDTVGWWGLKASQEDRRKVGKERPGNIFCSAGLEQLSKCLALGYAKETTKDAHTRWLPAAERCRWESQTPLCDFYFRTKLD